MRSTGKPDAHFWRSAAALSMSAPVAVPWSAFLVVRHARPALDCGQRGPSSPRCLRRWACGPARHLLPRRAAPRPLSAPCPAGAARWPRAVRAPRPGLHTLRRCAGPTASLGWARLGTMTTFGEDLACPMLGGPVDRHGDGVRTGRRSSWSTAGLERQLSIHWGGQQPFENRRTRAQWCAIQPTGRQGVRTDSVTTRRRRRDRCRSAAVDGDSEWSCVGCALHVKDLDALQVCVMVTV